MRLEDWIKWAVGRGRDAWPERRLVVLAIEDEELRQQARAVGRVYFPAVEVIPCLDATAAYRHCVQYPVCSVALAKPHPDEEDRKAIAKMDLLRHKPVVLFWPF